MEFIINVKTLFVKNLEFLLIYFFISFDDDCDGMVL